MEQVFFRTALQRLWICAMLVSLVMVLSAAMRVPGVLTDFRAHTIESNIPGGYALLVVDINNDGKPDVVASSSLVPELVWYENPRWERHVIVDKKTGIVNFAARDTDGDGIPEIAF